MQELLIQSIKILVLSCCLLGVASCNQQDGNKNIVESKLPHVAKDILVENPSKGMVYFKGIPFSGFGVTFYNLEVFNSKTKYLNGIKSGADQKWFDDGMLSYDSNYKDGLLHGKVTSWWNNGNKRSESNYVAGISDGIKWQWYKSGVKFKMITLEDGKESGLQQSWRENGKIYNNYIAKNGRIFGLKRSKLCFQLDDEVVQINSN